MYNAGQHSFYLYLDPSNLFFLRFHFFALSLVLSADFPHQHFLKVQTVVLCEALPLFLFLSVNLRFHFDDPSFPVCCAKMVVAVVVVVEVFVKRNRTRNQYTCHTVHSTNSEHPTNIKYCTSWPCVFFPICCCQSSGTGGDREISTSNHTKHHQYFNNRTSTVVTATQHQQPHNIKQYLLFPHRFFKTRC